MILKLAPLLLLIACTQESSTSNSTTPSSSSASSNSEKIVDTDFTANAVFQTNCLSCHGATLQNGAPFSLHTKESIVSRKSGIVSAIEGGTMPPRGALSTADQKTVIDWINTLK